ncbi:MAG: hypothetical protein M3314_11710 [Actinomycetota bacterium]|nr:hypothetical protein [Actinomycetota bacterium]
MRPESDSAHRASRGRGRGGRHLLLFLLVGSFLLGAAPAALAQAGYAGLTPPPPNGDLYVGTASTYAGPSPNLGVAAVPAGALSAQSTQGGADRPTSGPNLTLGDASSPIDEGGGGLLTRSDLVASAALGLAALVGFAVATGRLRSR